MQLVLAGSEVGLFRRSAPAGEAPGGGGSPGKPIEEEAHAAGE